MRFRPFYASTGRGLDREAQLADEQRLAPPEHPLLQLQHGLGNRAVQRLISAGQVRPRTQDAYEDQAERLTEEVLGASPEAVEAGRDAARREQNEAAPPARTADSGGGAPLPDDVRDFFAARLGRDLSAVRVHTGPHADVLARRLDAEAFTVGHDITFADGAYQPETEAGRKLLAHELIHVVQQTGGSGHLGITGRPRSERSPQRHLCVDASRFTPQIPMTLARFKTWVAGELSAVTGLTVRFAGPRLEIVADGRTATSATAARVLRLAIAHRRHLFIDPTTGSTHHVAGRGMQLKVTTARRTLVAMRPGIIILHELAHEFAANLKPTNYDQQMQALQQRYQQLAVQNQMAGQLTTPELDQIRQYNPRNVQADENIPVALSNQIRRERGLDIVRTQYILELEYPPPPQGTTGSARWTPYTQFTLQGNNPSGFIYQRIRDGELFYSTVDFVQQMARLGHPPTPSTAQMVPIDQMPSLRRFVL